MNNQLTIVNVTKVLNSSEVLYYTKYDVEIFGDYIKHTVSKINLDKNVVRKEEFIYRNSNGTLICDKIIGEQKERYFNLYLDSLNCSDTKFGYPSANELCFMKKDNFLSQNNVLYTNSYFLKLKSKQEVFSMRWVLDSNFVPIVYDEIKVLGSRKIITKRINDMSGWSSELN